MKQSRYIVFHSISVQFCQNYLGLTYTISRSDLHIYLGLTYTISRSDLHVDILTHFRFVF